MQEFQPSQYGHSSMLRPHRGAMILTFGILGIVVCFIFGIMAWVMGTEDLRQMDAGEMDPAGRDMTQIGRIMGIVITCLLAAGALLYGLFFIVVILIGVAGSP